MIHLLTSRLKIRVPTNPGDRYWPAPNFEIDVPCFGDGPLVVAMVPAKEPEANVMLTITHVRTGCGVLAGIGFRPSEVEFGQACEVRLQILALPVDWSGDPAAILDEIKRSPEIEARWLAIGAAIKDAQRAVEIEDEDDLYHGVNGDIG